MPTFTEAQLTFFDEYGVDPYELPEAVSAWQRQRAQLEKAFDSMPSAAFLDHLAMQTLLLHCQVESLEDTLKQAGDVLHENNLSLWDDRPDISGITIH